MYQIAIYHTYVHITYIICGFRKSSCPSNLTLIAQLPQQNLFNGDRGQSLDQFSHDGAVNGAKKNGGTIDITMIYWEYLGNISQFIGNVYIYISIHNKYVYMYIYCIYIYICYIVYLWFYKSTI